MNVKKNNRFTPASVLLLVYSLLAILCIENVPFLSRLWFPYVIVICGPSAMLAILLFMRKDNELLLIPAIINVIYSLLIIFFRGISVVSIIDLLARVFLAVFIAIYVFDVKKYCEKLHLLWFVPGALMVYSEVFNLFFKDPRHYLLRVTPMSAFFLSILEIGAVFMLCKPFADITSEYMEISGKRIKNYMSLPIHILLLILTLGIWERIWVYKTTKYLNCTPDSKYRGPVRKLLLYIFIPFYSIYWNYQTAKRIDKLSESKGFHSNIKVLCLVLSIPLIKRVLGLFIPVIMQDKINLIVMAEQSKKREEYKLNEKEEKYHMSVGLHFLLLFFTFGIWERIWVYKITKFLNITPKSEYRSPIKKLLLFIFIPSYSFYWTYKSAQQLDALAKSRNVYSSVSTVCPLLTVLLWSNLLGIISPMLMQHKINTIIETGGRESQKDLSEELTELKTLYDNGVITEEEFSIKKKQLLDI